MSLPPLAWFAGGAPLLWCNPAQPLPPPRRGRTGVAAARRAARRRRNRARARRLGA